MRSSRNVYISSDDCWFYEGRNGIDVYVKGISPDGSRSAVIGQTLSYKTLAESAKLADEIEKRRRKVKK